MVFTRKKILSRWFDFISEKNFFSDRWSILSIKKEKIFTDRSMLLVASMTDSIDG